MEEKTYLKVVFARQPKYADHERIIAGSLVIEVPDGTEPDYMALGLRYFPITTSQALVVVQPKFQCTHLDNSFREHEPHVLEDDVKVWVIRPDEPACRQPDSAVPEG